MAFKSPQAPRLLEKGKEVWDQESNCEFGKVIVDNKIMYTIYRVTGDKSKTQFGLMMFLLGCAQDGRFLIPQKTVEDRMGIKENTYYKVLKELVGLGLIDWHRGSDIVIRYDNIWKLATENLTGVELKNTDSTDEENLTSVELKGLNSTDEENSSLVELILKDSIDVKLNNINDSTGVKLNDWSGGF